MENIRIGVVLKIKEAVLHVFEDGKIWRAPYKTWNNIYIKGQWLKPSDNGKGYMRIKTAKTGSIRVHRLVARAFLSEYSEMLTVDHINGDKSDNRLENLRMMKHCENMRAHQKPRNGGGSRYRGVVRRKPNHKWKAQINTGGKVIHIGSFESEEDAAKAYNIEALKCGFSEEALNVIG